MKRVIRLALVASMLGFASVPGAWAQERSCDPQAVARKYPLYAGKTIKIAASPNQLPYAYSNPQNLERMTGLEVEMIEGAMACAGLKYEYYKGVWSGLLPALLSGSADMMIGNVNFRPDRAERADFVLYMRAGQSIVVQKGNPKRLADGASLCGASGSAVIGGSSAQQIERQSKLCIEQGKPAINFLPAAEAEAAYRQVANARIDFAMDDAASAASRLLKEPDFELAYTVTTDVLSGMVVAKGNAGMLEIVSDGLKVQERDGTLAALMKKYGLPAELLIPIQVRR